MAQPSGDLVAKLGKAPPKTKAGVFLGAVAVVGFLYWYLLYGDLAAERDQLTSQAFQLQQQETDLTAKQKRYRELVEQKKEVEKIKSANRKSFPSAAEIPAFHRYLELQRQTAGVELVKHSLEAEVPIESYIKVPLSIEVRGTYYELLEYFKLLRDTERIITVENLFIGDPKRAGDKLVLTAKFHASTFRQPDQTPKGGAK